MYQTISRCDFHDAFRDMEREDNFSHAGLNALYTYLGELEEDCGHDGELDVIALCCDFTEYKDLKGVQEDYKDIETLEDLQDNTTVIEFNGGLIIQSY